MRRQALFIFAVLIIPFTSHSQSRVRQIQALKLLHPTPEQLFRTPVGQDTLRRAGVVSIEVNACQVWLQDTFELRKTHYALDEKGFLKSVLLMNPSTDDTLQLQTLSWEDGWLRQEIRGSFREFSEAKCSPQEGDLHLAWTFSEKEPMHYRFVFDDRDSVLLGVALQPDPGPPSWYFDRQYDADGRRSRDSLAADGRGVWISHCEYDSLDRLVGIRSYAPQGEDHQEYQFRYHEDGKLILVRTSNWLCRRCRERWEFDALGRMQRYELLKGKKARVLRETRYTYAPNGREMKWRELKKERKREPLFHGGKIWDARGLLLQMFTEGPDSAREIVTYTYRFAD